MNQKWELCDIPIKFQLSDLTLFTPKVRVQVRSIPLLDNSFSEAGLTSPVESLVNDSQGFLIRSFPTHGKLKRLKKVDGYLCYVPSQYKRYYIDLRQTFEDYKQQFSSKTRSTINRKIKKYAKSSGGTINWKSYELKDAMDEFFQLARIVSEKTYQEKLLDAGLPDSEEFLCNMRSLAEKGQVRAFILFYGEKAVAYLYCPVLNGTLIYAYLGYDPEFRRLSVGTVLQWLALEHLFNESCFNFFDFTEGEGEHKRLFATHNVQCANVFFLRDTPRNNFLLRSHMGMNTFSYGFGRALDNLGVKAKVKKIIRYRR